jgi:hypothetical protein
VSRTRTQQSPSVLSAVMLGFSIPIVFHAVASAATTDVMSVAICGCVLTAMFLAFRYSHGPSTGE